MVAEDGYQSIAEHAGPFAEGEVGGDGDRSLLVGTVTGRRSARTADSRVLHRHDDPGDR